MAQKVPAPKGEHEAAVKSRKPLRTSLRFGLVSKVDAPASLEVARRVVEHLEKRRCPVVTERRLGALLGRKGVPLQDIGCDIMVTVGGDGTMLKTLQYSTAKILGINTGTVGFLAEVDGTKDGVEDSLDRVLRGEYRVERRRKLRTELNNTRLFDALNEAVLYTATIAKMQKFEVLVDGVQADILRADGIIVATPTGSTGYALSVGGPIVDPRVQCFLIVPIAPFKLGARPLIVPAGSEVVVRVLEDKRCVLVLDGQYERHVPPQAVLRFLASEVEAEFLRFEERFYDKVQNLVP